METYMRTNTDRTPAPIEIPARSLQDVHLSALAQMLTACVYQLYILSPPPADRIDDLYVRRATLTAQADVLAIAIGTAPWTASSGIGAKAFGLRYQLGIDERADEAGLFDQFDQGLYPAADDDEIEENRLATPFHVLAEQFGRLYVARTASDLAGDLRDNLDDLARQIQAAPYSGRNCLAIKCQALGYVLDLLPVQGTAASERAHFYNTFVGGLGLGKPAIS